MSTNSRNFLNIPSSISPVSSLQTMCMIIKQAQRASKKEEGEQPSADKEARSFPTAPRRCPSAMESVDLRNKHKRPCSDDQLVHPSALNPPYLSTTMSRPFRDQTHAPRVVPFVILRLKTGPTVMSLVPATRQVMLQGAFQLFWLHLRFVARLSVILTAARALREIGVDDFLGEHVTRDNSLDLAVGIVWILRYAKKIEKTDRNIGSFYE